jgi:hypothetical protein
VVGGRGYASGNPSALKAETAGNNREYRKSKEMGLAFGRHPISEISGKGIIEGMNVRFLRQR